MNDLIELERKLLLGDEIKISDIRTDIEQNHDEPFENGYSPVEDEINDILDKYRRLVELFGISVFEYDRNTEIIKLAPDFKAKAEYLLCIAKKYPSEMTENERKKTSDFFEEITAEAIKLYVGENAQSELIDRNNINIEELFTDRLKEKHNSNIKANYAASDLRSDIIVWKPLDDRFGKIILIVQCKSGKHWRDGHPVNINAWKSNIGDFSAEPIKAFAITELLTDNEKIATISKEKGLIFDRARIIRLLSNADNKQLKSIREEIDNLNLMGKISWD